MSVDIGINRKSASIVFFIAVFFSLSSCSITYADLQRALEESNEAQLEAYEEQLVAFQVEQQGSALAASGSDALNQSIDTLYALLKRAEEKSWPKVADPIRLRLALLYWQQGQHNIANQLRNEINVSNLQSVRDVAIHNVWSDFTRLHSYTKFNALNMPEGGWEHITEDWNDLLAEADRLDESRANLDVRTWLIKEAATGSVFASERFETKPEQRTNLAESLTRILSRLSDNQKLLYQQYYCSGAPVPNTKLDSLVVAATISNMVDQFSNKGVTGWGQTERCQKIL